MDRLWARMIAPLQREIRLMLARAVVSLVQSGAGFQTMQVELLDGEVRDGVEHFESYGFTSVPLEGAEGLFASIAGNRDHGILVSVGNRKFRLKGMKGGEVAMFTDEGDFIKFKRGRNMEVVCGTKAMVTCPDVELVCETKCKITCPDTELVGNLTVTQNIVAGGNISDQNGAKSMADMRSKYDSHDHNENNVLNSPTNKPNQLMS